MNSEIILTITISLDENETMYIETESNPALSVLTTKSDLRQRINIALDAAFKRTDDIIDSIEGAREMFNSLRNPKSTENNHEII